MSAAAENDALLRVSALHALLYCERLFFLEEVEEIRRKQKQDYILSRGEDAPVSKTIKRSQVKVGRNDPCPCGSGKKYKKCCGA